MGSTSKATTLLSLHPRKVRSEAKGPDVKAQILKEHDFTCPLLLSPLPSRWFHLHLKDIKFK